mmetsp:Transcript_56815/g.169640  ORF Transcript_56815/g.169640 Transcript_56815/m.169640 type:complete len:371 (-) Transcript_56815:306-1418(-)
MSPEEIAALFAAAREKLHPVVGQPTDAFINSLREVLTPILLEIPYDEANAKHSLIGLIMLREEYIVEYGEAFAVPKQLKAYPTVADDAKAPVRAKLEAEHKAQIADWVTFSTVERELRHFILDTFDETWYMELRNAKHFYTKVKPRDLLEHLQNECLGRHAVDVLQLTDLLRKCHVEAAGINEYINMLEDGQRQSIRIDEDNPITNGTLLNVATGAMLKTKQFPRANEEYEALAKEEKNWSAWKKIYKKAQGNERVQAAVSGDSAGFGGAATAHGDHPQPAPPAQQQHPQRDNVTLTDIEACFDNMAAAAQTQSAAFDELVKSNAALVKSVAELTKSNAALTKANKTTALLYPLVTNKLQPMNECRAQVL